MTCSQSFGVNRFYFPSCRKHPKRPSWRRAAKHSPPERWLKVTEWWWGKISITFCNGKYRGIAWSEQHTGPLGGNQTSEPIISLTEEKMFQPATCSDPSYIFYLQRYGQFLLSSRGKIWYRKCHWKLKFDTMQLQSQQKDDTFSRFIAHPSEVRVGHTFNGLCPLYFSHSRQSSTLRKPPLSLVFWWQGDWKWRQCDEDDETSNN